MRRYRSATANLAETVTVVELTRLDSQRSINDFDLFARRVDHTEEFGKILKVLIIQHDFLLVLLDEITVEHRIEYGRMK
ncbi:hypothetical protein PFISCL1PPCAC_22305, partial [Pristionchus fissidentatus]